MTRTQGLTIQRNAAARLVQTPYTLFLDDDVDIAPNFIESMERLLDTVSDAIAATAFVVADGAQGDEGLDRKSARSAAVNYVRLRTTTTTTNYMVVTCLYAHASSLKSSSMSGFRSMRGLRTLISLPIASALAEQFGIRRPALPT